MIDHLHNQGSDEHSNTSTCTSDWSDWSAVLEETDPNNELSVNIHIVGQSHQNIVVVVVVVVIAPLIGLICLCQLAHLIAPSM